MKATLTITASVLALALAAPAYAETPQNVPGTNIEGNQQDKNAGALTAPEANKDGTMAPGQGSTMSPGQGGMSDDSAANVPGTASEGDKSKGAAAIIPGTAADGDSSADEPSLGGTPKDKM